MSSGSPGINFVLNAVQASHQHGRESQIGIGTRVWAPKFHALGFGALRVHRNAHRSTAVALRIGQIDRGFIPGHQTLKRVGGRVGQCDQRIGVFERTADIVQSHFAQARVSRPGKERLIAFPEALMRVHARAIVFKEGFGHKGGGFAVFVRHVFDDVFVKGHSVGALTIGQNRMSISPWPPVATSW